ncbi:hypothetical protein EGR_04169 [Echinococcus granulosus]|uniref:Fibronectin type-III domain-containing protein n=1 Tax=Echinococcus granulosus TaxID=6210 RepID=W6UIL3_ECHGR|nr:hypothetical protein EGR_04169 [Echinococcus granulosus]EUB60923.1 hypothetical protein EGR_04169 [Echinococcus granulosus]
MFTNNYELDDVGSATELLRTDPADLSLFYHDLLLCSNFVVFVLMALDADARGCGLPSLVGLRKQMMVTRLDLDLPRNLKVSFQVEPTELRFGGTHNPEMRRITEEEASPRCDQLFSPLPLEGPSNPTVTAVSRTEVIVSWEPPGQFLLTRLRCYEVYINASTKPTYSGTQTFCHLRGLKPNCQYLFKVRMVPFLSPLHNTPNPVCCLQSKVQMVLKSKAVTDKATLNSKGGASRHYSENLQPPSSMHRRRRQAHDRPHVNGKSHLMKASLIGTTVVRITRGGKRPRPHRVAPIAACNSPDGSAYQQSLLLDKAATHPTTDSKSSRADQPERLLSCTQRVKESTPHGDELNTGKPHCHGQFLCKEERNCVKIAAKKNVELGQRIAGTSYNDHIA